MSLTASDIHGIAEIVKQTNEKTRGDKAAGEMFMRIAVGVCTAAILGACAMIFTMKQDLQANMQETKYLREKIESQSSEQSQYRVKVDGFMAAPRFTKDAFQDAIQPLIAAIKRNSEEISLKRSRLSQIEPVVMRNEQKVLDLAEDIDELEKQLDHLTNQLRESR